MHLRDVQEIAEETVRQPMVQAQKVQSEEVVEDARLDGVVSFQAELPLPLQEAMAGFIETCPNWDQYRLIKAALAGFLVQNGVDSREITRLYVANMFRSDSLMQGF
ncbi:conserved hypothetical protein [Prochlorococcus marinus str. MIT 9303]|uniref:DUF2811 domain-containing protein n=2 Tax=Prochlorococcaceae TaxID=2881426 RepID=A2C707_PROM3|nr:conserved hypothetical protein [Prochlorococcus marinus str. MIT 9303]